MITRALRERTTRRERSISWSRQISSCADIDAASSSAWRVVCRIAASRARSLPAGRAA